MILAGDIGGTNARLAFFDVQNGHFREVSASVFPCREYAGLDQIVSKFVDTAKLHPDAACFGVPGPVRNGRVETSNLPWIIESKRLADELNLKQAVLINDLEANAWGIATLDAADLVPLNKAKGNPVGNQAVISAGTGLGEAGMYWDGTQYRISATEGGHCDFAPRDSLEIDLFRYLSGRYGHVSYERIVSGPGLVNVFHFLRDSGHGAEPEWLTDEMAHGDPAAAISRAALEGKCALCEKALDLFVSVFAAEAANLALKVLATGGVYLGGGIAPKIVEKLQDGSFMRAFLGENRLKDLLQAMPVRVIMNDKTALIGAARYAATQSGKML